MRYEFLGPRIQYTGKTLWEILGNLKNFGVGRLVRRTIAVKYKEPSFLKINKVQPLPPSKIEYHTRSITVWADEYFNGRKTGENKILINSFLPLYNLIPKIEEEELYRRLAECQEKLPKRQIYKYQNWPPLYKKFWEIAALKDPKIPPLPKLQTIHKPYPEDEIVYINEVKKPLECELYKSDVSVKKKLEEIVHLKKLILAKTSVKE